MSREYSKDLKISVITGGEASERPGSLLSGDTMHRALVDAGYENVEIFDLTRHSFPLLASRDMDVAYLALHGGYGEDGKLQGALELLDVPYTGPGVAASAISANKFLFSRFVRSLGYAAPAQDVLTSYEDLDRALTVTFPAVVKPMNQGCSYGVFFVEDAADLRKKAVFAFEFGRELVLETYIEGREITVGLFSDPISGKPRALPIAETVLKGRKIIDFEVKAPSGGEYYETILPSPLSNELRSRVHEACIDIFNRLGCRGHVRFDIRIDHDNNLFFLENNTSPGMLNADESDFPKMLKEGGISIPEFADLMVRDALNRYEHEQRVLPSAPEMLELMNRLKDGAL